MVSTQHTPLVTVMVPCRNEAGFIDRCLKSILENGYPLDRLVILVLDGMSEDGTRVVLDRYSRMFDCVRVVENPGKVTPEALNRGVLAATGDFVVRVDAHASLEPGYIRRCIDAAGEYGADVVCGLMKTVPSVDSSVGRAIACALSHPFGVGNSYFRLPITSPKWVDTVFCGCYRREVFDRVGSPLTVPTDKDRAHVGSARDQQGPFNSRLLRGQDMDFSTRLRKIGGRLLLLPDISSHYYARSGMKSFCLHNWKNGVWALIPFAYSEVAPISFRHLIPLFFVTTVLVTGALGVVMRPWLWLGGTILGAYGAANLVASVHAAWRAKAMSLLLLMPWVFTVLHVSYGLGSLWGLARLVTLSRYRRKLTQTGGHAARPLRLENHANPMETSGAMKRLFDVIVASCGLVALSPALIILATLVKGGDGGPVFYRGSRVGLRGKPFRVVKFRTMVEQAERLGGSSTATGDPRVTRVGRLLRKYKLDELPQLINVFKGEMSVVGPRPEVQQYVDLYTDDERAILTVRPGLTDWASLWNIDEGALLEGSADPEKTYLETIRPLKLRLQLHYVQRHTFRTDMQILVRTVVALFRPAEVTPINVVTGKG